MPCDLLERVACGLEVGIGDRVRDLRELALDIVRHTLRVAVDFVEVLGESVEELV